MNFLDHTYAVILAGGGGTRLWPKSRNKTPKQFLDLTNQGSMLQLSVQRLERFIPWERMIVVTNKLYQNDIRQQLPKIPLKNIICEPKKNDTALAMLTGSLFINNIDPEAIIVNAAADHVVPDENEFVKIMKAAARIAAEQKYLITVGITPNYPATGFGYIKIGQEKRFDHLGVPVFQVESFTEKPNLATARAFLGTGRYFWNANMYVWSTVAIIKAFEQHKPDMLATCKPLIKVSAAQFKKNLTAVYQKNELISIDYAISEKADNLLLIPGEFGWNDIGEWQVVYDLGKKDLAGNVIITDKKHQSIPALTIESQNNLIHTDGRLIALLGVNDMIIVDTPEILLVAPRSKSQSVKKLVERLKEEKKDQYL